MSPARCCRPASAPLAAWLLALALGLAAAPAPAGESALLQVAATVRKMARLQVLAQPARVDVTRADIERGYVEVPVPLELAVRTNTVDGFMLSFENRSDFVRSALVRGLPELLQVGPEGGSVRQRTPAGAPADLRLQLAFRFELSAAAREGSYPWPYRLSAEPL